MASDNGKIVIQNKDGTAYKSFPLKKKEYLFGSDSKCDVIIKRPHVEKIHCAVYIEDNKIWLQNYVSTQYPVLLNGNPFRSPIQLCHEDIFSICSRGFKYLAFENRVVTRSKRSISPTVASVPPKKKRATRNSSSTSLEFAASLPLNSQTASLSLSYSEDERHREPLSEPQVKPVSPKTSTPDKMKNLESQQASEVSEITQASLDYGDTNTKKWNDKYEFDVQKMLFENCAFILSGFNKSEFSSLKETIKEYSGKIIEMGAKGYATIYLIAKSFSRTTKYIYCLCSGIPCLHSNWVFDSIKELRNIQLYLLPAGDASSISYGIMPQRLDRTLSLKGMHIELLVPPEELNNWQEIVKAANGIVVDSKSKKIDFIVAKSGLEIPSENTAVLPLEWLIQCAITKTLLSPIDFKDVLKKSKEFKTPPSLSKPSPPLSKQSPNSEIFYSSPTKLDLEKVQRKLDYSSPKIEKGILSLPSSLLLYIFSFLDEKTLGVISSLSKSVLRNCNHLRNYYKFVDFLEKTLGGRIPVDIPLDGVIMDNRSLTRGSLPKQLVDYSSKTFAIGSFKMEIDSNGRFTFFEKRKNWFLLLIVNDTVSKSSEILKFLQNYESFMRNKKDVRSFVAKETPFYPPKYSITLQNNDKILCTNSALGCKGNFFQKLQNTSNSKKFHVFIQEIE